MINSKNIKTLKLKILQIGLHTNEVHREKENHLISIFKETHMEMKIK